MGHFGLLSEAEIIRYKTLLEGKHAEVISSLPRSDNIAVDRRPDAADEAVLSIDLEIEAHGPDGSSTLSGNVLATLRRIESGAYDTCQGWGRQIGRKRLDAVPWTSLHQVPTGVGATSAWPGFTFGGSLRGCSCRSSVNIGAYTL